MFKKCLKYDLRAFGKIWLIAAAVMLVLAFLCSVGIGSLINVAASMETVVTDSADPELLDNALIFARMFIGIICYMVLIYSLVIFLGGSSIMVYVRYYIKFFTDQGYLTFTLPVRRSTQFWSKAVSGLIYSTASGLVALISALMAIGSVITALALTPEAAATFPLQELMGFLTPVNVICGIIALVLVLTLCTFTACRGKQDTTTPTTVPTTMPTIIPTTTAPTTTTTMPTTNTTEPMNTETDPADTGIGDSGIVDNDSTDNTNARSGIGGRF